MKKDLATILSDSVKRGLTALFKNMSSPTGLVGLGQSSQQVHQGRAYTAVSLNEPGSPGSEGQRTHFGKSA